MKAIYFISIIVLFMTSCTNTQDAQLKNPIPSKTENQNNISCWYNRQEFDLQLNSISEDLYPIAINAKPLLGDGVSYGLLTANKPSKSFQYNTVYGVEEVAYLKLHKAYLKEGYTLLHHQVAQLMAYKSHQAVWVKHQ